MNLVRKLKLNNIISEDIFSVEERKVLDFIESNVSKLTLFKTEKNDFFMNSKGDCIIGTDIQSKLLGLRAIGFLDILESDFKLNIKNIQYLIEYFLMKKLNYKISANGIIAIISNREHTRRIFSQISTYSTRYMPADEVELYYKKQLNNK